MDSATRIRHSGRVRASARLASSRVALALSVPCLTTKNGQVSEPFGGEREHVALVGDQAAVEQRG